MMPPPGAARRRAAACEQLMLSARHLFYALDIYMMPHEIRLMPSVCHILMFIISLCHLCFMIMARARASCDD